MTDKNKRSITLIQNLRSMMRAVDNNVYCHSRRFEEKYFPEELRSKVISDEDLEVIMKKVNASYKAFKAK